MRTIVKHIRTIIGYVFMVFVTAQTLAQSVPHVGTARSSGNSPYEDSILVVLAICLVVITVFVVYKYKTRDKHDY